MPERAGARPAQHRGEPRRAAVGRPRPTREQELFARHMEVYAGDGRPHRPERRPAASTRSRRSASSTTRSSSSLSDNGASREGEVVGTTAYYVHLLQGDDIDADYARLDQIGGPQTTPHYPRGWAMASGTRRSGSTRSTPTGRALRPVHRLVARRARRPRHDPAAVRARHRPAADAARADRRRAARRRATASRSRRSPARASPRRSPTPTRRARHREQLYEMQRAPRLLPRRLGARDPAPAAHAVRPTTSGSSTTSPTDPTELRNLAAERARDASRELADGVGGAAWENHVYPLDEGSSIKYLQRPGRAARSTASRSRSGGARRRSSAGGRCSCSGSGASRSASTSTTGPATRGCSSRTATRARGTRCTCSTASCWFVHNDGRGRMLDGRRAERCPTASREVVADLAAPRRAGSGTLTLSVDGERRGRSCRRPDAVRHRAVRGHRRRHRPALAGRRGRSTSGSVRSRTPARCTR